MHTIGARRRGGERGQVLILAILLFAAVSITVVAGITAPIVRQLRIGSDLQTSKQSYFAAEGGSEDAYYRVRNNLTTSFPETLALAGAIATVDMTIIDATNKEIVSEGNANGLIRSVVKDITVTDGFDFNFAVQSGNGGILMYNNAGVIGNVYSNGPIQGDNSSHNFVLGDVVSAGSSGRIDEVHATSSVYAHSISNSVVDKNAYYQTISGTTVRGTSFPGSADQPPIAMPIPDSLLDTWEANAVAGGTINSPCPYYISSNVTLGPKKINCDVFVSGNSTVITLTGAVWINGNLSVSNDPSFVVSNSIGDKSVPVITRSSSNPTTKGVITVFNNPTFYGSTSNGHPNPDSYVMFISRNTSAELGGNVDAISAGNNVTGNLLLYAPHGEIDLSNNVVLRAVTSYRITVRNNTQIYYTIGLAQPLFVAGPGGSWRIKRWSESVKRPL